MAIFLTQGRFTREYIKGGLAKPEDRHAAIARLCEQAGGKLPRLYFTLGRYDFLVITDMPDAKAASVLSLVAAGGGGIQDVPRRKPLPAPRRKTCSSVPARWQDPTNRWAPPEISPLETITAVGKLLSRNCACGRRALRQAAAKGSRHDGSTGVGDHSWRRVARLRDQDNRARRRRGRVSSDLYRRSEQ